MTEFDPTCPNGQVLLGCLNCIFCQMKAMLIRRYGGPEVVEYGEVETPRPGPGEVQIKVRASSVNPIDWMVRDGALKMFIRTPFPIILGVDFAGTVSSLGPGASRFAPGNEVYACTPHDNGAHAEFVSLPENLVALKPKSLSFEEAASLPAVAMTALQILRDVCSVKRGQNVLVNGASGGVGVFAVQLAKAFEARVTGVCGPANAGFVRSLGADEVVDYRAQDFAGLSARYDVILDCVATRTYWNSRRALVRGGVFVSTMPTPAAFVAGALSSFGSTKAKTFILKPNGTDLEYLSGLIEQRRIRPVVERIFPIEKLGEALAYSKTGHARGKIVLSVG